MQAPFKIPKRVKVTDEAKAALSAYKGKNKLGDPAKTLENLKNAKKAMFDILNEFDDSNPPRLVSIQTLLSLYIEKRDFASDTKESEKGALFKIPPGLRKVGQNDKKHFKEMDWNADYEKWQIFFFYRLVTKRLIQTLLDKKYANGSIDARWKNAAIKVANLKKKLWAETLDMKIQRMSGQKQPNPPAPAGEGKKKRRRGRGRNRDAGQGGEDSTVPPAAAGGGGEGQARARSRSRPREIITVPPKPPIHATQPPVHQMRG